MNRVTEAAIKLRDTCNLYGDHSAARGASEEEVILIKQTFAELRFPLPDALLDVYRTTLAIPGVLNDHPVLCAPCVFASRETAPYVSFLINQMEDSDEEGILWLGYGNKAELMIDTDGQCAVDVIHRDEFNFELVDPADFETAFLTFVARHEAEILAAFAQDEVWSMAVEQPLTPFSNDIDDESLKSVDIDAP